jgi:hypothetical protein
LNEEPIMKTRFIRLAAACTLIALAACGGGGNDDNGAATDNDSSGVPASALISWQAFSRWVGSRPASDSAEPLVVSDVEAPSSDSDDPIDGGS